MSAVVHGKYKAKSTYTVRAPLGTSHSWSDMSTALLPDGRILVVWLDAGKVYQAIAPNFTVLFGMDNWINQVGEPDQAAVLILGSGYDRMCAFNVGTDIYMTVLALNNSDGNMGVWFYKKTGDHTWTLTGTLYSSVFAGSDYGFLVDSFNVNCGPVTVFAGKWCVAASYIFRTSFGGSTFHRQGAALFTSSDSGATWTMQWSDIWGGFGTASEQISRDLAVYGGLLWASYMFNVQGVYMQSSPDGVTWTRYAVSTTLGPPGIESASVGLTDDDYFYIFSHNGDYSPADRLYRTTTPTDSSTWEFLDSYSGINFDTVLPQMFGSSHLAIWGSEALLIGQQLLHGWVVGRVAIG